MGTQIGRDADTAPNITFQLFRTALAISPFRLGEQPKSGAKRDS